MSKFNTPEDNNEQKVDYSKFSNDQLLDQFKSENWNTLKTDEQKIDLLQEVENRNAEINGREAATVITTQDPSLLGSYDAQTNTISIKLDSNQYENLDSVIHEGQHANQFYSTTNATGINQHDQNMINLEFLDSGKKDENGKPQSHYDAYQQKGHDLYNIHSSELNTNNTSLSFLSSQQSRYGNDSKYVDYLNNRNEHYNNVFNDLQNLGDEKKAALQSTLTNNYNNGVIDKNTYDAVSKELNSTKENDSFEKTAIDYHHGLNNMVIDEENHSLISLDLTGKGEEDKLDATNEEQEQWNDIANQNDMIDEFDNPIDYDPADYAEELEAEVDDGDENTNDLD